MFKNTRTRFGIVNKLLHWAIAALIFGLIWLGWYMVGFEYYDARQPKYLQYHREFGLSVLMLALVKFAWQAYSRKPQLHESITGWQRRAAIGTHHLLVLMTVLIPITGYLISTSEGAAINFFGLFNVPALVSNNTVLRDLCIEIHFYCAYGTLALAIGHAGAALKHQLIDRDGTLARMIWR